MLIDVGTLILFYKLQPAYLYAGHKISLRCPIRLVFQGQVAQQRAATKPPTDMGFELTRQDLNPQSKQLWN